MRGGIETQRVELLAMRTIERWNVAIAVAVAVVTGRRAGRTVGRIVQFDRIVKGEGRNIHRRLIQIHRREKFRYRTFAFEAGRGRNLSIVGVRHVEILKNARTRTIAWNSRRHVIAVQFLMK